MNRSILNFEATISSNGLTRQGEDDYLVRLYMNHHVVKTWTVPLREGYLMSQDRAHLDRFVAARLYEILHPIIVTDITP